MLTHSNPSTVETKSPKAAQPPAPFRPAKAKLREAARFCRRLDVGFRMMQGRAW